MSGARPGVVLLALLALVAGCTSGGAPARPGAHPRASTTPGSEPLTLTVWQQRSDPGAARLDQRFNRGHPDVRVDRVTRPGSGLAAALRRAVAAGRPPDLVEVGGGYQGMGALVRAGLLLPLDRYATGFRWARRYPRGMLDLTRFAPDGTELGSGRLYGLAQTGELVGIYYNRATLAALGVALPRTWAEFTRSLATIRAAGRVPIQFGDRGGDGAVDLFEVVHDQTAGADAAGDLVFARDRASWASAGTAEAARTVADWAARGYLSPDAGTVTERHAVDRFASGEGAYLVAGTGLLAGLERDMGAAVGFLPPPPATRGDTPVSTGGPDRIWAVPAASRHADLAAAYLDALTNGQAADVLVAAGSLPVVAPSAARVPADTAQADVLHAWGAVAGHGGLVPALDYVTPTFHRTLAARLRDLLAGRVPPARFADPLQRDFAAFHRSR